ncbi:MAG: N-6 DNA methylase [Candidatus Lokiarchaeota archaeon]|nr:N-6 DNA methylase [Candidatus Lokiarchaeota archaeon]
MVSKFDHKNSDLKLGQVFTPDYVARFMVYNITNIIQNSVDSPFKAKKLSNLNVLEPSAGKGIFLKYLKEYGYSNIRAYEIDDNLKRILLKKFPQVDFRFENFLSSEEKSEYDLVIGNPPYLGQNYNAEIFQEYAKNYPLCSRYFVGNMDLFYYFIHLGIEKLKPAGYLTFITTDYWVTKSKKTGIKLLKPHILEECFLTRYFDLSNLVLFKGAQGQHNCIFVLQKKTPEEKTKNKNRNIEIVQLKGRKKKRSVDVHFNKQLFRALIGNESNSHILRYISAISNQELEKDGNWNLLYPFEIKKIVKKIERYCLVKDRKSFLCDYFIIRNGLIFIKDDIFILKEDEELKVIEEEVYIKINEEFKKLNNQEKKRLKKIYKSSAIKPYGYKKKNYMGYAIFFNKLEFNDLDHQSRNIRLRRNYPALISYLLQYKEDLEKILINAKEKPVDIYFPRRGAYIKKPKSKKSKKLTYLEPFYEKSPKIFFRYISKRNIFGYTSSSYYATSHTYFFIPKSEYKAIDYPFLLAYLNSKLVYFLFKAKNIKIKRSKTKLEYGLPIPNLQLFSSEKKNNIISLIRTLSSIISRLEIDKSSICKKSPPLTDVISKVKDNKLMSKILKAVDLQDIPSLRNIIDNLFFRLFDIDETKLNDLVNRYYL